MLTYTDTPVHRQQRANLNWEHIARFHSAVLTSRTSWVRLMFMAEISSHLIFTSSALRHRSCIPFTIPSVTPGFPTLSLLRSRIPTPCSRRSSSRGSVSSAADGGVGAAAASLPRLCLRRAASASPSPVAQLGSSVEPTRWRGSWAGVGTKISPGDGASALRAGAGMGVSGEVSRYPRLRSLSEMRRSADLARSSGSEEAEARTGGRRE